MKKSASWIKLEKAMSERILVLDGAMGSLIQEYKLEEEDFRGERWKNHPSSVKGNNDMLVISQPQIIKEIHARYFAAGADLIETNTFSGTSVSMADYGMEDDVYDLNYMGAKIAKDVADDFTAKEPHKPRFVVGAIGPTTKIASMSPDVSDPGYRDITFDQLHQAYALQIKALLDGGSDILLVETVTDTLNAKACLFAIQEEFEKRGEMFPVMVSGTITDASGRTLSGQTAEAFLISVSHVPLLSIGFNCALGAKMMKPYLKVLADNAPFSTSAHPNAGLPNEFGAYDETPEQMVAQIREFLEEDMINIIGGCCGTTPEHIQAIAACAAEYQPRKVDV
jgi:5-methyltetrahydrofolate--homocysteine methyltransferase